MSDLDDEAITVTISDEVDGSATVEKAGDKPADKPVEKQVQDDPISDLKGQFEQLKGTLSQTTQRLVGAEREIEAKNQEIAQVRKEVTSSQLDTVLSGIQAATAEAEAAESEYVTAAEAGDFKAQARAQRKISAAEAKIQRLKEAEGDLKDIAAKPAPKQEARQPSQSDPVENFAKNMSPRSAAWIRSHPDCVTDPKKNARMLAAHNLAVADDIPVDSDEYFARIEAGINPAKRPEDPPAKPQIRPSAPVAPAGNGNGPLSGGVQEVKLSLREINSSEDGTIVWNYDDPKGKFKKGDPIGRQEMGRRKLIMQRQGLYDKSYDIQ